MVSSELGVGAFERRISVGFGLLDASFEYRSASESYADWTKGLAVLGGLNWHTHFCGPFCSDYAETSSSIL